MNPLPVTRNGSASKSASVVVLTNHCCNCMIARRVVLLQPFGYRERILDRFVLAELELGFDLVHMNSEAGNRGETSCHLAARNLLRPPPIGDSRFHALGEIFQM